MKLSTKCRYGVRAMLEIGRQYRGGGGPVKRKDIAQIQGISHAYLENILISLKAAKFIRTTRGANGGFILEREPSEITMLQLVTALEGSITPVECLDNTDCCEKTSRCVARRVWKKLQDAQVAALSSITLQDLLDMEKETAEPTYTI